MSYFTVWREPGKTTWRFTLWGPNGKPLVESLTAYSSKAAARNGCEAVRYCFAAGSPPVLDARSQ